MHEKHFAPVKLVIYVRYQNLQKLNDARSAVSQTYPVFTTSNDLFALRYYQNVLNRRQMAFDESRWMHGVRVPRAHNAIKTSSNCRQVAKVLGFSTLSIVTEHVSS